MTDISTKIESNIDVKSAIEKIRAAQAEYKALISSIGTEGLKDLCKEIIAESGAQQIRWAQYTPYFNDGDPCEFGVGEPEFIFANDDTWYSSYDLYSLVKDPTPKTKKDWRGNDVTYHDYLRDANNDYLREFKTPNHEKAYNLVGTFSETLRSLEDVLLEVFGDHVQITFEDDHFEVSDYDHD